MNVRVCCVLLWNVSGCIHEPRSAPLHHAYPQSDIGRSQRPLDSSSGHSDGLSAVDRACVFIPRLPLCCPCGVFMGSACTTPQGADVLLDVLQLNNREHDVLQRILRLAVFHG
jgi:hypothetical protein